MGHVQVSTSTNQSTRRRPVSSVEPDIDWRFPTHVAPKTSTTTSRGAQCCAVDLKNRTCVIWSGKSTSTIPEPTARRVNSIASQGVPALGGNSALVSSIPRRAQSQMSHRSNRSPSLISTTAPTELGGNAVRAVSAGGRRSQDYSGRRVSVDSVTRNKVSQRNAVELDANEQSSSRLGASSGPPIQLAPRRSGSTSRSGSNAGM